MPCGAWPTRSCFATASTTSTTSSGCWRRCTGRSDRAGSLHSTRPSSRAPLRTLKERYHLRPERTAVEARHQLTPDQYRALLEAEGFAVNVQELQPVTVSEQGWIDISHFSDFAAGVLPGIPIETASAILCETLRETFAELDVRAVPRNWLSVIAVRPPGALVEHVAAKPRHTNRRMP